MGRCPSFPPQQTWSVAVVVSSDSTSVLIRLKDFSCGRSALPKKKRRLIKQQTRWRAELIYAHYTSHPALVFPNKTLVGEIRNYLVWKV